jgi:cell division protein FtsQ
VYVSHVREWRQQFDKLESVDLRYDRQIIVNPDLQGTVKQPPLSKMSAKVAVAAGMKPAALITHQIPAPKSIAALTPASKPPAKVAGKKTVKRAHRKAPAKGESKPVTALAQTTNVAKSTSPATQSPSAQTTTAPATSGKTTPAASPVTGTVAVKPGNKPSPAIVKGEEHP